MGMTDSISRLKDYYTRHGLLATIRRARLALKRTLFSNRMVVYYCDLTLPISPSPNVISTLRLERLRTYAELDAHDLQEMTSFWNPKLAHRSIQERFEMGASLWLIRSGDKLAGYGWTSQGRTIEPYYFPLGSEDFHLFGFYVFAPYRGRGINPFLVTEILRSLSSDCGGRAFIEAAEWNEAQLCSLPKTPFRRLGMVRSFSLFGRRFVSWVRSETPRFQNGLQRSRLY